MIVGSVFIIDIYCALIKRRTFACRADGRVSTLMAADGMGSTFRDEATYKDAEILRT